VTRRQIMRRIRLAWPDLRGLRVLGYGFAPPYLKACLPEAERAVAFIPNQLEQWRGLRIAGSSRWEKKGRCRFRTRFSIVC